MYILPPASIYLYHKSAVGEQRAEFAICIPVS